MTQSTGLVRHLDALGRIVIPVDLRRRFQLPEGAPLEVYAEGDVSGSAKMALRQVACNYKLPIEDNGSH